MIKRIPIHALRLGMFIQDLNCGWLEHGFVRNSFALTSERDLRRVQELGVRELYIDTRRGLDSAEGEEAPAVEARVFQEMVAAASQVSLPPMQSELVEEVRLARAVQQEANQVVQDLLTDVRLGRQIEVDRAQPVVERVVESIFRNPGALVCMCRLKHRDCYTFQHSVSVCALLVAFTRAAGFDGKGIREAGLGGLLHDVGKMVIPDEVLNKPGALTEEEFRIMRTHVERGRDILMQTPGIPEAVIQVTAQHHERYRGHGYPLSLRGPQISRVGQMAAIVDVYDAITSDRVYHRSMEPAQAMQKLFEWSRHHFDEDLVHAFVRIIGIYPVGSLVRLESERLAVVVQPSRLDDLLRPVVRTVYDLRDGHFLAPHDLDLAAPEGQGGADRILGYEVPADWDIDVTAFL